MLFSITFLYLLAAPKGEAPPNPDAGAPPNPEDEAMPPKPVDGAAAAPPNPPPELAARDPNVLPPAAAAAAKPPPPPDAPNPPPALDPNALAVEDGTPPKGEVVPKAAPRGAGDPKAGVALVGV